MPVFGGNVRRWMGKRNDLFEPSEFARLRDIQPDQHAIAVAVQDIVVVIDAHALGPVDTYRNHKTIAARVMTAR